MRFNTRRKKIFNSLLTIGATYAILKISKRAAGCFSNKGGDRMSVLEVLALLNLLAVVIFGILGYIKK